jgi:hypothetical protein
MIQGDRTGFAVVPNPELLEGATDQELKNIKKTLTEDEDLKQLKKKIVRCNTRVKLFDRIDKLLVSTLLFGRNALGIERFPKDKEWPKYGQPRALKHLSSLRITDVTMDKATYEFLGLDYDFGRNIGVKFEPAIDLVPAFWDDNNVQDNTNYSGTSAAWAVLSACQSIDVIMDEDIPESVRQTWAKFGIIYAGTSKKAVIKEMIDELKSSTWFIHNQAELRAEVHDLKSSLQELTTVTNDLSKFICMSLSLPLFLLFEDTANYATAEQVMQVYKNGLLKRNRTWLQGILEDYWYKPILADHLMIDVEDVIESDWRIKATFQEFDFSPRKSKLEADKLLFDMNVYNREDVARSNGLDEIAERIKTEELDNKLKEKDGIIQSQAEEIKRMRQLGSIPNMNGGQLLKTIQQQERRNQESSNNQEEEDNKGNNGE